jgi:two-component system cell cycle response regulator
MYKHKKDGSLRFAGIPRSFWYSLTFAVSFLILYLGWLLSVNVFHFMSHNDVRGDVSIAVAAFISLIFAWIGPRRATNSLQRRFYLWVPLAFSGALLCQGIGNLMFAYYNIYMPDAPPIPAMLFILGMYPGLLIGIFLLPRDNGGRKIPLRIIINSLMLIMTLITFSWYFVLGPILFENQAMPIAGMIVNTTYGLFDLMLIICLILLSRSISNYGLRNTIRGLSLAMILFVLTDSTLLCEISHSIYDTTWISLGWIGGNFALALSLQALRWQRINVKATHVSMSDATALEAMPIWRSLLPYALIPLVFILVFSLWGRDRTSVLAVVTYCCSLLLLALIFVKQFLAIQEMHDFNRALQILQHVVEEKNGALKQANAHLEALATTDPLTGLPNHRALFENLEKEVERSRRYGHSLSILFFDGDHFKRVNDTHGHSTGDTVLRELGSRAKSVLRGGDTIGRYGGEEFMVLLPETDLPLAREVAERLRVEVATHLLATEQVKGGLHITISIGVATFPIDGQSASEVVEQADQAMYWAKRLGRNQIRTVVEAQQASADSALAATISNLERSDDEQGQDIEQVVRTHQLSTIQSLMWLLELRDRGISTHSYQVSDLAGAIAQELGLKEAEVFAISTAGLLHDIGKIAIPDHLLQKAIPLSENEQALMKQHPELGAQILEVSPYLQDLMPAVHYHHENWDGTGYPDALAGEDIPLAARIIRVSEAYETMLSDRPYQAPRTVEAARNELRRCSGKQFDAAVVEATLQVLQRQEEEVLANNISIAAY